MLVLNTGHLAGGIKHNHDKGKNHYGHDFIYIIIVVTRTRILVGNILNLWGDAVIHPDVDKINDNSHHSANSQTAKNVDRIVNTQVKTGPTVHERP